MEHNAYDVTINISENVITIFDSYRISNDDEKRKIIHDILSQMTFSRSEESLFDEWKAHNILYSWGWYVDRTKDVDFEANEALWKRIVYWLIALLFDE